MRERTKRVSIQHQSLDVDPPPVNQQRDPHFLQVTMMTAMDKRRIQLIPERQKSWGLKGSEADWQKTSTWLGLGRSETIEQDRVRISLAGVSVHGILDPFEEKLETRGPGIIRLDRIAKEHDIDYSLAKNLKAKNAADHQAIKAIKEQGGRKTLPESTMKGIMPAKTTLNFFLGPLGTNPRRHGSHSL